MVGAGREAGLSNSVQPVRGMNDVLPVDVAAWQWLEKTASEVLTTYGYEEIRVPIVEHTELFKRAIGEHTDVVSKEMYTFQDQGGDSLTLRPEATAGVVRAAISNNMLRGQKWKLWCSGPMFRHERPQKGRYRQFHQISVEAIGYPGPDVDVELLALAARLWRRLGIERIGLQINSLGTPESRRAYREKLIAYFRAHEARLDADSKRRLEANPMRILDSKNPEMQELVTGAPVLTEHLDAGSREHFDTVCASLRDLNIPFQINPRLVRGLDYYSHTVFEWITDALGAQDAVCSGGRYDGLITQLGGEPTPAIGFAMGMERVVELLSQTNRVAPAKAADVYIVTGAALATARAMQLAEGLREALPHRAIALNLGGGNFKAQFKRADKSGATLALILGDDEISRGVVALKPLRQETGQSECSIADLPRHIEAQLSGLMQR
jgi:histidyl-tRNA synthetase